MSRATGPLNPTFAPRLRLGSYELLMELARGGVATAIVARKVGAGEFDRLFVVKRVHRSLLANQDFSKMFRDEARLASSIRHPNVASVIDVIEAGPELCLVMEYFEALSLSTLLTMAGAAKAPSPRIVARIMGDVLAGLDAAHEATDASGAKLGIVHRDLSPHNIIIDTEGVGRVIDFGIAKATSRLTQTRSGIVKGKVAYMAPEQIEAQPLDRRTDVFAAGIVLHEMLTGRGLFHGRDEFETMRRILGGPIPAPSAVASGVSPALDAVVKQALERSPKARFPTALAFRRALEAAIPPASAREASVWVQRVSGSVLSTRRRELFEMLRDGAATEASPTSARGLLPTEASPPLLFVDPAQVTGGRALEAAGLPTTSAGVLALGFTAAVVGISLLAGAALHFAAHRTAVPSALVDAGR